MKGDLEMNKKRVTRTIAAVGFAGSLFGLMTTGAFAQETSATSSFQARYAHNVQVENTLLAKAQAAMPGGTTSTYAASVQSINAQSAALYSAYQTLLATRTAIPKAPTIKTNREHMLQERNHLELVIKQDKNHYNYDQHHHARIAARVTANDLHLALLQLNSVNYQLEHRDTARSTWNVHPLDNGVTALEQSILDLQMSAMHYTNVWIGQEHAAASSTVPASVYGLAYQSSTVTLPAVGAPTVVDAVAAQPVVKTQTGAVLQNQGVYSLSGPTGATGVSIESANGTLLVAPGATAGLYTVTYTQQGVSETVQVNVAP